ncbi:MAG: CRTAC1 family protein, partial [Bryobacteraceae bacterium]
TEKAGVAGLQPKAGKQWSISAGWFDYDNDGKLDLLVVNYVKVPKVEPVCKSNEIRSYCAPDSFEGTRNILYHNNGDGTFTDVSEKSRIGTQTGKGMGVAFADYDGDGYADVFVSNDTFRNFLFHNNRNGTFSEVGILQGVAYNDDGKSIAAMGADFRDIDNDGHPDIFVTGMRGDTFPLFRNADGGFSDITNNSGVARATAPYTAWGAGIFDFDNDGDKDLFTADSSILDNSEAVDHLPSKLNNQVLRNLGNSRFVDVSHDAGESFSEPRANRGAAFGDLNNDGRIDVVVTAHQELPQILMNRSANSNHWILLNLVGTKSNRDAIGAKAKLTASDGRVQYNHVTTSVGLGGSSDKRVHFGIGGASMIRKLEIVWPSGTWQVLHDVRPDQVLTIREQG